MNRFKRHQELITLRMEGGDAPPKVTLNLRGDERGVVGASSAAPGGRIRMISEAAPKPAAEATGEGEVCPGTTDVPPFKPKGKAARPEVSDRLPGTCGVGRPGFPRGPHSLTKGGGFAFPGVKTLWGKVNLGGAGGAPVAGLLWRNGAEGTLFSHRGRGAVKGPRVGFGGLLGAPFPGPGKGPGGGGIGAGILGLGRGKGFSEAGGTGIPERRAQRGPLLGFLPGTGGGPERPRGVPAPGFGGPF